MMIRYRIELTCEGDRHGWTYVEDEDGDIVLYHAEKDIVDALHRKLAGALQRAERAERERDRYRAR